MTAKKHNPYQYGIAAKMLFATLAAATLLLTSCSVPKNKVRIEGKFSGIEQAEFYVYNEDNLAAAFDTIKIDGGKFKADITITTPCVLTLLFPNFSEMYVVAEPGKKIDIQGDAGKLAETDIAGSDENKMLTKFRLENLKKPKDNIRMAAANFIRSYPSSLAALAVFKQHFVKDNNRDAQTALSLLDALKKAQPQNLAVAKLDDGDFRRIANNGKGKGLPDFSAISLNGKGLRKADLLGKPSLIVFWASWSGESNYVLDIARMLRRAYPPSKLNIMTISLDIDAEAAKKQLKADSLESFNNVCEKAGISSPLARKLGMQYVPGNLLTDSHGTIVDRDIDKDKLRQRVEQLISSGK